MSFVKQILMFIAILAIIVLGRYYYFVNYEASPYSEVGQGMHEVMPPQIQAYGCRRLHERFPTEVLSKCDDDTLQ